jgi:xanthine dehydrogenase accessory factor
VPASEIFEIVDQLLSRDEFPCALATLVAIEGSSYRRAGARRLIGFSGTPVGGISGGCLEQDIDAHARSLLKSSNRSKVISYDTSSENDLVWGVGTGCHGIVHVLIEKLDECPAWARAVNQAKSHRNPVVLHTRWKRGPDTPDPLSTGLISSSSERSPVGFVHQILPPQRLVIFGAGDDAIPVHRLANQLGWETKIFDPRPAFPTKDRFPEAVTTQCEPAEKAVTAVDWDDHTAAIIMTHHYLFDLPLLKTLVPLQLPYLGLLGPKERGQRLLKDAGFNPLQSSLHYPVGLDLGGDGAEAVALAIVSEIHAHLNQRTAQPLSRRERPIHDT